MTLQERQELAENYLGLVDWQESGTEGYCRCPGQAKHTTPNGPKDCIVYVTGVPTVHCFHRSCQDDTDEYSAPLRKVLPIDKDPGEKPFNKSEWKKRAARNAEIKGLAAATSERLLRSERSQNVFLVLWVRKSHGNFFWIFSSCRTSCGLVSATTLGGMAEGILRLWKNGLSLGGMIGPLPARAPSSRTTIIIAANSTFSLTLYGDRVRPSGPGPGD